MIYNTMAFAGTDFDYLEVSKPPDKSSYEVGDVFEPDGMVIKAVYKNCQKEEITDYTITQPETMYPGKDVTVSYTRRGKTAQAKVPISVQRIILSIPVLKYEQMIYRRNSYQSPLIPGYVYGDDDDSPNSSPVNQIGVVSAVNAGTYTAIFSIVDPVAYEWEDGTTEDKSVTWVIEKAERNLEVATQNVSSYSSADKGYGSRIATLSQANGENGEFTIISSDESIVKDLSISRYWGTNSLYGTFTGETVGTATITIIESESENFYEDSVTLEITYIGWTKEDFENRLQLSSDASHVACRNASSVAVSTIDLSECDNSRYLLFTVFYGGLSIDYLSMTTEDGNDTWSKTNIFLYNYNSNTCPSPSLSGSIVTVPRTSTSSAYAYTGILVELEDYEYPYIAEMFQHVTAKALATRNTSSLGSCRIATTTAYAYDYILGACNTGILIASGKTDDEDSYDLWDHVINGVGNTDADYAIYQDGTYLYARTEDSATVYGGSIIGLTFKEG